MKRTRCKIPQQSTVAKCGSNLMNHKHDRASAKRAAKSARRHNDGSAA